MEVNKNNYKKKEIKTSKNRWRKHKFIEKCRNIALKITA